MADANFDEFVTGTVTARSMAVGRAMNIAGAFATLALIVFVAIWGYRVAMRDAHGVPVIQAMQGPMRVTAEEPGGMIAPHTGLSVNRIAAEGAAGQMPDSVTLAPPPVGLEEEDTAGIGIATPESLAAAEEDSLARTLALAEQLALQAAAEIAAAEGGVAPAAVDDALPAGPIQRSIRPMPRPGTATMAAASTSSTISAVQPVSAATTPATVELAVESLAPGTRLAQIGTFTDIDSARAEWDRMARRHASLFEGKSRVIQPANSVGNPFFRLRVAGFDSEDDSRRFCSAVQTGDLRCTPVTTR